MREIKHFERSSMKKFPVLKKSGGILNGTESTPFVYKNRLLLLSTHWNGFGDLSGCCAAIRDYFTQEVLGSVGGEGYRFYSAFCENDHVYVFCTKDNCVYCYHSDDLKTWDKYVALRMPEMFELFNTSVCKGDGVYMMAIECAWAGQGSWDQENKVGNPYIGEYYTEFFARSADLVHWGNLPFDMSYTKERYNACPALRYCEGYYYMICLERLPCNHYAPYMYRTQDFATWELGLYNPILIASEEDRHVKEGLVEHPKIVADYVNTNNSDVDLCEYEGKTYIVYNSGHQGEAKGFNGLLCEAVYEGTLSEYLKANFE